MTIATTVKANAIPDRYVNAFIDRYEEGLNFESAEVDAWHLVGNEQRTESVEAANNSNNRTVTVNGDWPATKRKSVTSFVTYRADKDLKVGDTIRTGASVDVFGFQTNQNIGDVCVTVRPPNPVEAAGGSLENIGLGSVNDGIGNITGSVTNPTGSIADLINQIDIGKIIGGVIGGAVGS